jgi:hypothetical protein
VTIRAALPIGLIAAGQRLGNRASSRASRAAARSALLSPYLKSKEDLRNAWLLKEALKGLYGLKSAERAAARLARLEARFPKRLDPLRAGHLAAVPEE